MTSQLNRLTAYALPKTSGVRNARHKLAKLTGVNVPAEQLGIVLPSTGRTLAFDIVTLPTRVLVGCEPRRLADPRQTSQTPRTPGLLHGLRAINRKMIEGMSIAALPVGALLGAIVGRVVSLAFEEKANQAMVWCLVGTTVVFTAPFLAIERAIDAALWANTACVARLSDALGIHARANVATGMSFLR